jgi:AbrB family looped-hinge helix DNA binding protein
MPKVSTKGQVTIPQAIREELGLLPDTEVVFEVVDDTVVMRAVESAHERARRRVESVRGTATVKFKSTDELMRLLRGDDWPSR